MAVTVTVNGKTQQLEGRGDQPLLYSLRNLARPARPALRLRLAQCGACSVHLNGEVVRSCSIPVASVKPTDRIVTIEGLSPNASSAVQKAWAALDVPQCGYCQSGQIMAATALLKQKPKPTDADIDAAMTNICRCGTYQRIRAAIHMAAGQTAATPGTKKN